MVAAGRHIRFLASVRNEDEALLAMAGGADIIDCKEPRTGALGALPLDVVAHVRHVVPAHLPVSATIGDVPCEPAPVVAAVGAMAATGVDYVKIGFFPGGDARAVIAALKHQNIARAQLVAVLFADQQPDLSLVPDLASAGFAGVMLDTAAKAGGSLLAHQPLSNLSAFVKSARSAGVFAGLAGSLRLEDIDRLRAAEPDFLGFRGALCTGAQRAATLDARALAAVRAALSAPAQQTMPKQKAAVS